VKRLSLRALLYWLAPTAGVGTLAAQARSPADPGTISVDTLRGLGSQYLAETPTVRVFLPSGYQGSGTTYPVLYANDGQDMEAVGLVRVIDSLVSNGMMSPIIVVAVHAGEDRLQNYGTVGQPNGQGLGAAAHSYEGFLVRELIPLIARRYRGDQSHAAIMGWSLGGLSAFDLAWRNSGEFDAVGVFSGSFWWRTDDSTVASKQASRIMHRRVRETSQTPHLRIWLEVGKNDERDDRDNNGVIDAIQDTRELMRELEARGLREGREVTYREVDGGHNTETWATVLPEFLRWAFPAGG
jgi:enterochelin esterase family protein